MAEPETTPTAQGAALPDFYTNPNAVLGDLSASWRYGKPPDYSKTRKVYEESEFFLIFPLKGDVKVPTIPRMNARSINVEVSSGCKASCK